MSTSRTAPAPAERLLAAAASLFPQEGIRAVGIERLISEADVARASLYHAFGSKDALIAAYLKRQDEHDRAAWQRASARAGNDPEARILAFFDLAADAARRRRYQGCLYLNAATELADPDHPAIAVIAAHRAWLHERVAAELTDLASDSPAETASAIQLLYDGALAGSKLDRSTTPIATARAMAQRLITDRRNDAATTVRQRNSHARAKGAPSE